MPPLGVPILHVQHREHHSLHDTHRAWIIETWWIKHPIVATGRTDLGTEVEDHATLKTPTLLKATRRHLAPFPQVTVVGGENQESVNLPAQASRRQKTAANDQICSAYVPRWAGAGQRIGLVVSAWLLTMWTAGSGESRLRSSDP